MSEDGTYNRSMGMTEAQVPEEVVGQEFIVDMPDVPLPQAKPLQDIEDTFKAAFNVAVIGAGQGGGRLAQAFWQSGYRRVVAINTAEQDLAGLDLPNERKLVLGGGGAGKDPAVAARVFSQKREDVLDLMRRGFGRNVDRVLICVGAGGGTGGGSCVGLIELAKEFMTAIGKTPHVGVVVSTPKRSEGQKVRDNAVALLKQLNTQVTKKLISPLIRLDNERIDELYPGLSVQQFWSTANRSVVSLFHLFNTIAIRESSYTSFDQTDYKTLLDSGSIVFGAMPVQNWKDETAIAYAVRENLKNNVLAGDVDITTGGVAAAIVVASKAILDEVPQRNLEHAFEQLSRILKGGNTVHRGIYLGSQDALVVYTMIGGLGA